MSLAVEIKSTFQFLGCSLLWEGTQTSSWNPASAVRKVSTAGWEHLGESPPHQRRVGDIDMSLEKMSGEAESKGE